MQQLLLWSTVETILTQQNVGMHATDWVLETRHKILLNPSTYLSPP